MKYLIEEATLTGIADAVREKKGTTDLIQVSNLATEISNIQGGGTVEELTITSNGTYNPPTGIDGFAPVVVNVPQDGAPTAEDLTFSGDCQNTFSGGKWDWLIRKYGNQITTKSIWNCRNMFASSKVEEIPFILNGRVDQRTNCNNMFYGCTELLEMPEMKNFKISNIDSMFRDCFRIREIPLSFALNNDWSEINKNTNYGVISFMFYNCYSLRTIPPELFNYIINNKQYYYSSLYYGFQNCYSLDEITNLPCYIDTEWTNNGFSAFMNNFYRVNKIEFSLNEDGTPKVSKWKGQTIDLTKYVGVSSAYINDIIGYNSGITADKEVKDDATYQALKNDPDWFSRDINYSRYNHDSAVNTINSLPDTSAYLTANGGTNTIKFKGQSGASTDGGAINTLTEEEIAVATAKGWTVALV